jgi:phage/plasmid-associated DNA primase
MANKTDSTIVAEAVETGAMKQILAHLVETARANSNEFYQIELSEAAFADFIGRAAGGLLRHSSSWGWLVYDETSGVFIHDDRAGKIARLYIEDMARLLIEGAYTMISDQQRRDNVYKFAAAVLQAKGRRSVETLLQDTEVHADADGFDRNPDVINCDGLVFDFQTGETRPASPSDMFTRTTGIKPALETTPEKFCRFLLEISYGDSNWCAYLVTFFGYAASGDMGTEIYLNLHGGGGNGKSTMLRTVNSALGDYAGEVPRGVLCNQPMIATHPSSRPTRNCMACDSPTPPM